MSNPNACARAGQDRANLYNGITDKIINDGVIPSTKSIAKETGAKLIDLNTPLKGKAALVPDSVHPNAGGARIMAETIAKALKTTAKAN